MTAMLWLAAGVLSESIGLVGLRASGGMRRPVFTVLAFAGLLGSLALVGQALSRGMTLAVAYGVWTGAGIAFAALSGSVIFGDRLTRRHLVGLGLIMLGVVALNATGSAH